MTRQHQEQLIAEYKKLSNAQLSQDIAHFRFEVKRAQDKIHLMEVVVMQRNLEQAQRKVGPTHG
jgi:hypothetical protein